MDEHMQNPRQLSPLTLAYIGDAVFELLVRKHVLRQSGNTAPAILHERCAQLVCAKAQSRAFHRLRGVLHQDELSALLRGRNANAHSGARSKNTSVVDYRHATGVEALFGYLFLSGQTGRIAALFDVLMQGENEGDEHGV
jgi:ribonuclease-3 family protein